MQMLNYFCTIHYVIKEWRNILPAIVLCHGCICTYGCAYLLVRGCQKVFPSSSLTLARTTIRQHDHVTKIHPTVLSHGRILFEAKPAEECVPVYATRLTSTSSRLFLLSFSRLQGRNFLYA